MLVAIEWKYTEHYGDIDKSLEGPVKKGAEPMGAIRRARYAKLLAGSGQIRPAKDEELYREPFYQLMRQTLLLEQLVRHRDTERLGADGFLHVHAVPSGNRDLLDKAYLPHGLGMEAHWRRLLVDARSLSEYSDSLLAPSHRQTFWDGGNCPKLRGFTPGSSRTVENS